MNKSLPIFPLGIVVLPGNIQSLQIFEPRYLKMIKDVMHGDNQFVISLLSNTNQDISFKDKGTLVEIIDFNDLPNGLLGITVKGTTRVEISSAEINEDDYHVGQIFPISEPTVDDQALLAKFPELINVLSQLKEHPKVRELPIDINLSSADSVSFHLGGLIPLSPLDKQLLLDAFDAGQRLNILSRLLDEISTSSRNCLLYTSPSPRDLSTSRMPSSA